MSSQEDEESDFGLLMPFWIDTDGYTDRDRAMFVAGAEFEQLYTLLRDSKSCQRPIHRENESRVRLMCGRLGLPCKLTPHTGYIGCETWTDLEVLPRTESDAGAVPEDKSEQPAAGESLADLAKKIAADLFRDGCGNKTAARLLLLHGEDEIPGSGWGEAAMAERIRSHLEAHYRGKGE